MLGTMCSGLLGGPATGPMSGTQITVWASTLALRDPQGHTETVCISDRDCGTLRLAGPLHTSEISGGLILLFALSSHSFNL